MALECAKMGADLTYLTFVWGVRNKKCASYATTFIINGEGELSAKLALWHRY